MWSRVHTAHHVQFAKAINKLGFPVTFKDFKVQNVVGSCNVNHSVRLELLAVNLKNNFSVSQGARASGLSISVRLMGRTAQVSADRSPSS